MNFSFHVKYKASLNKSKVYVEYVKIPATNLLELKTSVLANLQRGKHFVTL